MTHKKRDHVAGLIRIGLALMVFAPSGVAQPASETQHYPPPGKLVDVGGWRLHLNCAGNKKRNAPTVVLESGAGDFSLDWSLVQPSVARFTRVCSYDRAGSGWSDLGPRPRTVKQATWELHTALMKLGVTGPYVLVGHSIGGLLIRSFAYQYPKEVAGMVLVDSAHEDSQLFINGKIQRVRETSSGKSIPPIQTTISASDRYLSQEEKQKIEEFLKIIGPPRIAHPYDKLPPEIQRMRLWATEQLKHYTADDDPYVGEEFAEFYARRQSEKYPLGNIPLIVLTRGGNPGLGADAKLDEERQGLQKDLLLLSRNSKQMIANASGHHIHIESPELVTGAIRQVVDSIQHPAHRPKSSNRLKSGRPPSSAELLGFWTERYHAF